MRGHSGPPAWMIAPRCLGAMLVCVARRVVTAAWVVVAFITVAGSSEGGLCRHGALPATNRSWPWRDQLDAAFGRMRAASAERAPWVLRRPRSVQCSAPAPNKHCISWSSAASHRRSRVVAVSGPGHAPFVDRYAAGRTNRARAASNRSNLSRTDCRPDFWNGLRLLPPRKAQTRPGSVVELTGSDGRPHGHR